MADALSRRFLALSPDGRYLAVGNANGTIYILQVAKDPVVAVKPVEIKPEENRHPPARPARSARPSGKSRWTIAAPGCRRKPWPSSATSRGGCRATCLIWPSARTASG